MWDLAAVGITPMTAASAFAAGYALGWVGMRAMAERASRKPTAARRAARHPKR